MINRSKDSTTTVKVVCAILFVTFVFTYVYNFQYGLLEMIQYAWADGKTHYDRTIGAVIITAVMVLLSMVMAILTSLPQRINALIYFPAFLTLGLLTAVEQDGMVVTTSRAWLIAAPLMLVAYVVAVNVAKQYKPFLAPLRSTTFLSQPWWTNLFVMVAMMLLTFNMGNTDRTLHTRLAVENACQQRLWDKALAKGFPQYDNDSSLTMLRAMALANKGELGKRLFRYDITGDAGSLMPRKDHSVAFLQGNGYRLWQTIGFVPRDLAEPVTETLKRELRRHTARPAARDYLLCAYLLNKDLDGFMRVLPHFYAVNETLPQHYKEAYVMYCKKKNITGELRDYQDAAMDADYDDFMTVMRSQRSPKLRAAALRDAYFGTYWYYFYR